MWFLKALPTCLQLASLTTSLLSQIAWLITISSPWLWRVSVSGPFAPAVVSAGHVIPLKLFVSL